MTKKQKTTMGICFLLTFGTFISQQVFAYGEGSQAVDLAAQGLVALDKEIDKEIGINQKAVDLEKKLDEKTGINQKAVDAYNAVNQAENKVVDSINNAFKGWHW